MKNRILSAAVLLTVCMCSEASAGQLMNDGTGIWYQNDDGTYVTGWFTDDDGSRYFFDENGYAKSGWFEENGKDYYFQPESGKLAVGYATVLDRKLYFFDEDGVSRKIGSNYTGWLKDDANWYYQNADSSICRDGWKEISGVWYYFGENGYMKTGLLDLDGVLYYLDGSGAMVSDTEREVDGTVYRFDSQGIGTSLGTALIEEPEAAELTSTNPPIPPEDQKSEAHKAADAYADQILSQLINDQMTKRQKAEAIYAWVRGTLRYSGSSATRDWGLEAYEGFRRQRGDCFTYFSLSHELLTRAGIESMMIVRSTDNHHYWNLVQVEEGWYHFDTCPRSSGGYFCLWTNDQMAQYSNMHGRCFAFDPAGYPKIQ